ncbi:redoxin domain-containing protein [Olivibacter ginsenosidimutans]|uniref:Redoxin domain-containing protein n=1 Tax=Olivibacter ginsenosidimutans TaxID=1176537 RepID=A0ABP9B5D4_9SPHI
MNDLYVRGELCPFRNQYKNIRAKALKLSAFSFVLSTFLFCVCLAHAGQRENFPAAAGVALSTDSITPLKIGDTIPEALWNLPLQMVQAAQEGSATVTLKDYKGKLIILDFWATWCTSCIAALPKMHNLADDFKDQLAIVPVTYEKELRKIKDFLETNKYIQKLKLQSVYADSSLNHFFPHSLLPHYVWINPNGRVETITSAYGVSAKNIAAVLNRETQLDAIPKIDLDKDSLLVNFKARPEQNLRYYSVLYKGRFEGLGAGTIAKSYNGLTGYIWSNLTLMTMYAKLGKMLIPGFNAKQLAVEVSDSVQLFYQNSGLPKDDWYYKNAYTLEFLVPATEKSAMPNYLLTILNQQTPFSIALEYRKQSCLVLQKLPRKYPLTKGGKYENTLSTAEDARLVNVPIDHLVAWLNTNERLPDIVVDETGNEGNIDLNINTSFNDLEALQAIFRQQGLLLKREKRRIALLVIRDKKQSTLNN